MFRTVRLRLTAYIIAVLGLMLMAVGAVVYVLLTRQLDAAVETRLRAALPQPITVSARLPAPSLPGGIPGPGVFAVTGVAATPPSPPEGGTLNYGYAGIGPVSASVRDGVFVIQWQDGEVLSPPDGAPPGLPDMAGLGAATVGHDDE